MKIVNSIIVALAVGLLANANAYSETVHQTVRGDAAVAPEGGTALSKKLIEVKTFDNNTAARIVGTVQQWGYVSFWFGLPAPAGKVIARFKVYVDDTATADYGVYVRLKTGGQTFEAKLQIPADAKKNSLVDIDVPIDAPEEWNGLSLKKMAASDKPSPWIDSVSIVLP